MRFGTWKVSSLYRLRFLTAASRELVRYKLDLVGVQEWDKVGTVREGAYIFFYGEGKENRQLGKGFLVHLRIVPEVKRVEFVSDRM